VPWINLVSSANANRASSAHLAAIVAALIAADSWTPAPSQDR
jgi:hypothetical protein